MCYRIQNFVNEKQFLCCEINQMFSYLYYKYITHKMFVDK